ncbi:MAG: permease-like cell division protein FtsX [Myxococcales bacterium]|nr:permease-like cell division protein FtsX [Myxococcales bacterium]
MSKPYRFLGTWRAGRSNWRLQALSIFSLAVAFVCLASALLVVTNLANIRERWSRAGRATVYLRDDASEADVQALVRALEQTDGVARARYVSREVARSEVVSESGDQQLASLPPEAFPASVELGFSETVDDMKLSVLALKLQSLPSVETVETYHRWTERLSSLLTGGVTASLLLALVVFAAVVSVVASTMRLLLEKRRLEVEVLRLVGATTRFVCRPFVVEGAVQGAAGAGVAVLLLGVLYQVVSGRFSIELSTLLGVRPSFLPWQVVLGMVAVGAVLGSMTAFLSLRKAVKI